MMLLWTIQRNKACWRCHHSRQINVCVMRRESGLGRAHCELIIVFKCPINEVCDLRHAPSGWVTVFM